MHQEMMKVIRAIMGATQYVVLNCDEVLQLTTNLGYLFIIMWCRIG